LEVLPFVQALVLWQTFYNIKKIIKLKRRSLDLLFCFIDIYKEKLKHEL
jgi:hypothetical protein